MPAFLDTVADRLALLPAVEAVTLGGSRAQGTERPDSDWDLAVYYRGAFDPADLRAVGWEGEVCEIGAWGGGVFNGGAWLTIEGRRVDVHYRDLDVVEHEMAEAEAGRFRVEPLMFHLAGIPTYLLVAELAINKVLRGELPRPGAYPRALRESAPAHWHGMAAGTLALRQGRPRPEERRHPGRGGHRPRRDTDRARGAGGARGVGHQREGAGGAGGSGGGGRGRTRPHGRSGRARPGRHRRGDAPRAGRGRRHRRVNCTRVGWTVSGRTAMPSTVSCSP